MVAEVFDMTVNLVFAWHTISPSLPSDTSSPKAPKVSAPAPDAMILPFVKGASMLELRPVELGVACSVSASREELSQACVRL